MTGSGRVSSGPRLITLDDLERAAQLTWLKTGMTGVGMIEQVAIGFVNRVEGKQLSLHEVDWLTLHNERTDVGAFEVRGENVHDVLAAVSMIPRLAHARRILWHTHTETTHPSAHDLAEYPWFVDLGVIYHVPSHTTTLYNSGGIIQLSAEPSMPSGVPTT